MSHVNLDNLDYGDHVTIETRWYGRVSGTVTGKGPDWIEIDDDRYDYSDINGDEGLKD